MEKIKQALEKARNERNKNDGAFQAAPEQSHAPEPSLTATQIRYTKTRSIPGSEERMRENRLVHNMQPGAYTDALKILSTQTLQRLKENDWSTVMVTSPRESEGKTTTAINLGLSMAREVDYTVLLVDANLRKPSMHEYFGLENGLGLSNYLSSDISLSKILVNPRGIDHFVIMPGGAATSSSPELLGSPKMSQLVDDIKGRYQKRIIVFDVPSVLDTADTLKLAPLIDSALLVIEDDHTTEKDVQSSISMLSHVNILGTVLNKSMFR